MTTASATGIATLTSTGDVLDVWYPEIGSTDQSALTPLEGVDEDRNVTRKIVTTTIDTDAAPTDTYDAWLRLHLLSHRVFRPHSINLDGIFGLLNNVVWTNFGPCAVDGFALTRARLSRRGQVTVYSVDKFPRMVDYVVPSGVRIGDADRVRLGAYLADGTTVMHEGFVNFNAGTLGVSMVEGRISAGVTVDDGTDVGGGASIMGTLSGGGQHVISLGKRCLLGANSGCGIPLGDDCIIEAGLYITAGTKVLFDGSLHKASTLAGSNGLIFRRDSVSGQVVAVPNTKVVELNTALHSN